MRITIKTLQQSQFPLEISLEETILQVKEKISQASESKNVPVERQKLIHAGRVLENEQLVSQTTLKEGDFIVLMTVTTKPTIAATGSSSTSASVKPSLDEEKSTEVKSSLATSKTTGAESHLVTGEAYEDAVNRLVDMGFEKEKVTVAMRASFNNPERAVEYLTTGMLPIEDNYDVDDEQRSNGGNTLLTEGETITSNAPRTTGEMSGSLDFLRNDPQFQQLRALIHQNPQMLGPIIEQLSQTSPELLQLIEQNREEFYALIMEGSNLEEMATTVTGEGGTTDEDDLLESGQVPPGAQVLRVSEEDRRAIERLESMGFDRARVVEAFFACDKNEELAANFLLEHLNDQD